LFLNKIQYIDVLMNYIFKIVKDFGFNTNDFKYFKNKTIQKLYKKYTNEIFVTKTIKNTQQYYIKRKLNIIKIN